MKENGINKEKNMKNMGGKNPRNGKRTKKRGEWNKERNWKIKKENERKY